MKKHLTCYPDYRKRLYRGCMKFFMHLSKECLIALELRSGLPQFIELSAKWGNTVSILIQATGNDLMHTFHRCPPSQISAELCYPEGKCSMLERRHGIICNQPSGHKNGSWLIGIVHLPPDTISVHLVTMLGCVMQY